METETISAKEPLIIDEFVSHQLGAVSYWARFISISGIVFGIFFILSGLAMVFTMPELATYPNMSGMKMPMGSNVFQLVAIVYVVIGIIVFIVSLFLLKFANQMKTALLYSRQDYLAHAFKNLKMVYKTFGIVVVINIVLMILGSFLSSLVMKGIA